MAKYQTARTGKKVITRKDVGKYISLLTDFGFKRVFGTKELMLKFLNTILDIEGGILDLQYGNPEKVGIIKTERKAIFDLYCITGNNEHIIVEIQCASQVFFKDRSIFYASRMINSLSKKGKDWNYELPRIFSINILDFTFEEALIPLGIKIQRKDKNKYFSIVQLIDRDTGDLFYDKLTLVYIELPCFTKELEEVKTIFEQWIFIIKNLHKLEDLPKKFSKNKIFKLLFEIAKVAKMTTEEYNKYLKDLDDMNLVKNEIRTLQNFISERDNVITQKDITIAQKDITIIQHINTIAQKDNALAAMEKEVEELRRQLGLKTQKV